ncbi:MAG: phenylalanine--tRNA ligase subunit beta [Gaiellales bacterium]|nr:MAG: phenylalanine--tRNA ligase subunit beta [Gaiellales bacterium]
MKVPFSWLKEYVDVDMTAAELADRLALTGTEVERVAAVGIPSGDGNLDRFVIGQVETVAPHPDADKLTLCGVDVGGRVEKIVCGAKNFREGDRTAVCLPGGVLPDGRRLEAAEIRGVRSNGMMCSEAELGISSESAGIMILPEDAPVGERLVDHVAVHDEVLELEVTPNRPDCLSVYGVAREVAAVTGAGLSPEPADDIKPEGHDDIGSLVEISVADPDLCPRYGARLIAGVKVGPSPAWLKARIVAAGMRPVNNVVDITNYVMWTLGEPMHAFDLAKVAGKKLVVRRAREGEKIRTIDGVERSLTPQMLVIADGDGPTAIAGIMGSEASEVSDDTSDILLEAANFDGPSVMATSMELGLRSESSTRFEKGMDVELVPRALAMASRLMTEICGGRLVPGEIDIHGELPPANVVHLRSSRIASLIGVEIDPGETAAILERLGFTVEVEGEGGFRVTVPCFRADVEREVDLIEEVVRVYGLDLIPTTLPSDVRVMGGLSPRQAAEREVARALAGRGLDEVITYSFIAPDYADRLRLAKNDTRRRAVVLDNPISVEQSVMRTIMLPSLLMTVARNAAVRNTGINIFERGVIYLPSEGRKLPDERRVIAACLTDMAGEGWISGGRAVDFYTGKGLVEAVFATVNGSCGLSRSRDPFLHPGKSADIMVGGERAGYVGEVHPLVLSAFDLDIPVTAFEVDLDAIVASSAGTVLFEDLMTYPASYQDLAVVVDDKVDAEKVLETVRSAGAPLLHGAEVFDIYSGEQVAAGSKSIALRLEFRSPDHTLTDDEVNDVRAKIVRELEKKLKATLRV